MAKKTFFPARIAPLQRVIAKPITDPVERAAIDKIRKRKKRNEGARHAQRKRSK
jgi:hypothetical protein